MTYISTVTSKGTITLPAALRARLGIKEGDKVEISLRGNTIVTKPRLDWEEFFAATKDFGEKARARMQKTGEKPLLTNAEIEEAAQKGRASGY